MALGTDVKQFAAQSVADIHHAGGVYPCLTQSLDDVSSGFRLQLALKQIFTSAHVGLEIIQPVQLLLVA